MRSGARARGSRSRPRVPRAAPRRRRASRVYSREAETRGGWERGRDPVSRRRVDFGATSRIGGAGVKTPTSRRARGRDDDGQRGATRVRVVGRQNPRRRHVINCPFSRTRGHPVRGARFGAAGDGSVRGAEARTWRVRALILGAPSRRERAAARGTGARAAVAAATAARENDMG